MRSTSASLTLANLVPRDIFAALDALGIDAEQAGDEAKALCPNPDHNDSKPSWSCNLDTGMHHCFSCGYGGSFVYLVGCMLGLTRADSETWVQDRKVKDVAAGHIGPRVSVPKRAVQVSEADMWRFTEPPAKARASRGLTLNACTMYDVRWDNEHELWITAVRDKHGRLLGWQEKNDRQFNNRPKHLVKSGSLYGYGLLPQGGTALLVESPLDCPFTLPGCPVGVVPVSSYGASVSGEQVALLRARAGRIILALDNDKAGWRSVGKLAYAFGATPVLVFRYPGSAAVTPTGPVDIARPDGRDPGNLSMDEISSGIDQAIPSWRIRIPWL